MNDRTMMQQALEALENHPYDDRHWREECQPAITALRAALEEIEPFQPDWDRVKALQESLREHMAEIQRLRAALAEPVQEPVASVTECEACFTPDVCQLRGTCDHYAAERLRVAAPPQRKLLTDEQIEQIADGIPVDDFVGPTTWHLKLARAIERAHGIE